MTGDINEIQKNIAKPQILMIGGGMTFRGDEHAFDYYKNIYSIDYASYGKSWKD